jgi:hypothetical protein
MILYTDSWLILSHSEITPSVRAIIDGRLAHQYTIESNEDGVRILFDSELRAKSVWEEIEEAWSADEDPAEDDEEPAAQPSSGAEGKS